MAVLGMPSMEWQEMTHPRLSPIPKLGCNYGKLELDWRGS